MRLKILVLVCLSLVGFSIAGSPKRYKTKADLPKKIAAVCTAYQPLWHGDVIVTKFLADFPSGSSLGPWPPEELKPLYSN